MCPPPNLYEITWEQGSSSSGGSSGSSSSSGVKAIKHMGDRRGAQHHGTIGPNPVESCVLSGADKQWSGTLNTVICLPSYTPHKSGGGQQHTLPILSALKRRATGWHQPAWVIYARKMSPVAGDVNTILPHSRSTLNLSPSKHVAFRTNRVARVTVAWVWRR